MKKIGYWVLVVVIFFLAIGVGYSFTKPKIKEQDQQVITSEPKIDEDFTIQVQEDNVSDTITDTDITQTTNNDKLETKTPENKEKSIKIIPKTKQSQGYTQQQQSIITQGLSWVSIFDDRATKYNYKLEDEKLIIGDWVFELDDNGNINKYITKEKPTKEQVDKLENIYPWGEMVSKDGQYEWIKPSVNCSKNTIGWDYEKDGIAEGCPTP